MASDSNAASQRYTFSGKENQATTPAQAPYLDFGARMYSAESVRWLSHDPLAEKYYAVTPFAYCNNNPVIFVDPDGEDIYLLFDGNTKELQIWYDADTLDDIADDILVGVDDAHNNVTTNSQGKWEDGTYEMLDTSSRRTHGADRDSKGILKDSSEGSYGLGGCYRARPFSDSDGMRREGMAVYAGRENNPDFYSRKTQGYIRTTPEAMQMIDSAISEFGQLRRITIKNNPKH